MKAIKAILFSLLAGLTIPVASGQVIGKVYQPGDSIIMDGMVCMVIKVDDSGLHGTAMGPYAKNVKDLEKEKKNIVKYYEKEVKKGKATPEDLQMWTTHAESQANIPELGYSSSGKQKSYKIEDWTNKVPDGWRLPTSEDAEAFSTLFYGGIGENYGAGFNYLKDLLKFTPFWFINMNNMKAISDGFIIKDEDSGYTKFLVQKKPKATSVFGAKFKIMFWLEISDSGSGKEKTVPFKDF